MIKTVLVILFTCVLMFGVNDSARSNDPMNPTNFSHQAKKTIHSAFPGNKVRLSIARVHDNILVGTPFGRETGGVTVKNIGGDSPVIVESSKRYDTSGDEVGYGKRTREFLLYYLSTVKSIQLIERDEINALVREWDFNDTKYVRKSGNTPAFEMPELIAKGVLLPNDNSCASEDSEEEAWGIEKKKDNNVVQFILRLYDVKTAGIKLMVCGTGKSRAEAVEKAVNELKKKQDILLPTVRVIFSEGNSIRLDGGNSMGLLPGTGFYLVRSEEPKEAMDYEALDYVAFCKVVRSEDRTSMAVVKETFSSNAPQPGDMVFYYFQEESW